MVSRHVDTMLAAVFTVLGIAAAVASSRLSLVDATGRVGPGLFPLAACLMWVVFSGWELLASFRPPVGPAETPSAVRDIVLRGGPVLVVLLLAVWLLDVFGYLVMATAVMAALMWLMGERRGRIVAGAAVGTALLTYVIFVEFFGVGFHAGPTWL